MRRHIPTSIGLCMATAVMLFLIWSLSNGPQNEDIKPSKLRRPPTQVADRIISFEPARTLDWPRITRAVTQPKEESAILNEASLTLRAWASANLEELLDWVSKQDEPIASLVGEAVAKVLEQSPQEERFAKINEVLQFGDLHPKVARRVYRKAVDYLLEHDRGKVVEFAMQISANEADVADDILANKLNPEEVDSLVEGLLNQGANQRVAKLLGRYVERRAALDPRSAAAWANQIQEASLRASLLGKAFISWRAKDSSEAAQWASTHLRDEDKNSFMYMFSSAKQ